MGTWQLLKSFIKHVVDKLPFGGSIKTWTNRWRQSQEVSSWQKRGRPDPPPQAIKQEVLRELGKEFGLKVFVETGTHYGDTLAAVMPDFAKLYSIELSADLHAKCVGRFAGCAQVEIIHGDSGIELGKLVPKIAEPALFWLDGHYSGGETARGTTDTPVLEELRHILVAGRRHVIVIDDARCFGKEPGYPPLRDLTAFVKALRPDVDIAVKDDSIRITP